MIRLTCHCGRALKAPDKLAGKESRCPACGATIVVRKPAEARIPIDDDSPEYALAAQPHSTFVPRVIAEVDPNHVRTSVYQKHRFERFIDPLVGVKYVSRLSGMLSVLTAIGVAIYPTVLHEGFAWMSGVLMALVWSGATALAFGYGCQFLDSVLEHAVGGGAGRVEIPDYDPATAFTSLVRWGLCFVSGPAFLLYFAFCYWIHCGDIAALDRLILAELTIPAVGYGILGLLVLAKRPDLSHLSPRQVVRAAHRLGYRSLVAAIGVTAVAFAHVWLGAWAIVLLHDSWLGGLIILWICWFSAWQCASFALRTLGFWEYHRANAAPQQAASGKMIASPSS